MIAYKCNYCDKWTNLFNVVSTETDLITGKKLYFEIWNCDVCKVHHTFNDDEKHMITLFTKIREQDYTLSCLPQKNLALLSGGGKVIKSFDAVPDVNPQNVQDKIRTYLTFL